MNKYPLHCHGIFSQTATPVANIFGNVVSDSEGRDGSSIVRRTRSAIPRDQKVTLSRHMMPPKLRFSCGLKAKAPGAVMALLLFPLRRRARRNFYRLSAHRLNTRSNDGEGEDFFFLPFRVFQVYDRYFTNVLTQPSCFEVLLTAGLAMFHSRRCSYIRTDDPSTKTGVHCELEHRGLRSLRAVWSIFSHQAPPSPVFSVSQSPPPFPSPSLSTRRNQLSRRSPSSGKHSNVQLVPACVASGNPQRCFPPLDKNRAKHRRTVFSMNKAQESKQRSTN